MTKAYTPPPLPTGSKLKLRWIDEFAGASLDTTKWMHHIGDGSDFGDVNNGWFNKEKQCYVSEAVTIDPAEKCLLITASPMAVGGECKNAKDGKVNKTSEFTSAKIITKDAFCWTGTPEASKPILISARMKVPLAERSFPALWLLPMDPAEPWKSGYNASYGGWCTSGEIDIMEHLNKENSIHCSMHFEVKDKGKLPAGAKLADATAGSANMCARQTASYTDFAADNGPDKWHVYSALWDAKYIKIYVDDKLVLDMTNTNWELGGGKVGSSAAPFDKPFNLIINHAVGGTWVDTLVTDKTKAVADYPCAIAVDFVAVFDVTLE
jgi:beta-glucanase (GH16 family)